MLLDTAFLARLQFAFTISFHILFPAFSIGLVTFLAVIEGLWLKTKNQQYLIIARFWTKVFALTFGMGVVSGIVMEFQLGTNWAGFTQQIGGVLGALFTYEVMTAFFIEAGFLGVMLFGWNRVGPKLHYLSTLLVLIGTTLSAYWILAANSWMQHPVGYEHIGNHYEAASWSAIILNTGVLLPRFLHMLLAAYLSASFVIISVSAYYLLKSRHPVFARRCFRFAWLAVLIIIPLQLFLGDMAGREVHANQPIKTAAIEGIWQTQRGAPYLAFAIPDPDTETNHFAIPIPHGAALINTHQWNGKLTGLTSVPKADRPYVPIVFFSFRIMVYIGMLMLLLALLALYLRLKKRLDTTCWFQKLCVMCAPLGFIALWCGWLTAEVGRQPWIVYGLIRTNDAASHVPLHNVMISFALILIVYGIIFGVFYFYFLHKVIRTGPQEISTIDKRDHSFAYMSSSVMEDKRP